MHLVEPAEDYDGIKKEPFESLCHVGGIVVRLK